MRAVHNRTRRRMRQRLRKLVRLWLTKPLHTLSLIVWLCMHATQRTVCALDGMRWVTAPRYCQRCVC